MSSLSSLLAANGTLSERELRHPSLPVVGILDLIRTTDDGVLVVDFKTGAARPEHQEQVELYALLWWRNSGEMPARIAVQYLNGRREWNVTREHLERFETTLEMAMSDASTSVRNPPGMARPTDDCAWCVVRARCDEGWTFAERLRDRGQGYPSDVEAVVASSPSPTGYLIRRADGTEVSLVFDASVGAELPRVQPNDRVRLVGVLHRGPGELEMTPSSELYRMSVECQGDAS
jgi:PD-(D/E)XK nuclease superfamily